MKKQRGEQMSPFRWFLKAVKTFQESEKGKAFNNKVMVFITLDNQLFSVVENPSLCNLIPLLAPRYTIPSHRLFSHVSLPALNNVVATHTHNLINKNPLHVRFTSDIWTSDASPVSMHSGNVLLIIHTLF